MASFEAAALLLAALLHELADDALGLAQLRHGEHAQLVQAHHLGHGGKDHGGIEVIPYRRNRFYHLVGQVFDKR